MAGTLFVVLGAGLALFGLGGAANARHVAQWQAYVRTNPPGSGYSLDEVEGVEPAPGAVRRARLVWGVVGLAGVALAGYGLAG